MTVQNPAQPMPARFSGIINAGDRAKALRQAKRHSALVSVLKFLLPAAALGIAGLYFIPREIVIETPEGEVFSIEDVDLSAGGLKMVNPRFQGVHEKQGTYDVRADNATQQITNPDLITLNKIDGELVSKTGGKTVMSAPSGLLDRKKEEMSFDNGLVIGGNAGFSGQLQTGTAFFKSNKLVTTDPVQFNFHSSTINAEAMTFYSAEKRAIFQGKVRVHLERQQGGSRQ